MVLTTTLWFLYKATSLKGSILGPLLFNFYIRDMLYDIDICDIASYADDNTPYTSDFNLEEVIQKLELTTNNFRMVQKQSHESQR